MDRTSDAMNLRFRKNFVRLVASLVTIALITSQTGCANFSLKESSSPEQPPGWNRVGVASLAREPRLETMDMPRTHGILEDKGVQGAAGGGAAGAGAGLALCTPSAIFPPAYAICVAGLGLSGMAVGLGVGEVKQNKDDAEKTLGGVQSGTRIQNELRERVVVAARSKTSYEIVDLGAHHPPPSREDSHEQFEYAGHSGQLEYAEPVEYVFPREAGIDVVLEMTLHKVLAQGLGGWKDEFEIKLTSRSRLIRISDDRILASRIHYYRGPSQRIGENAAEQTDKIRHSIRIGIETLAHDIVAETLLHGATGADSNERGHPEFMD